MELGRDVHLEKEGGGGARWSWVEMCIVVGS